MKLLSITGKEEKLNDTIANILLGSGIQPENALKVLEKGWKLTYYTYESEIKEIIKQAENLAQELGIENEITDRFSLPSICLSQTTEQIKIEIEEIEQKINTQKAICQKKQEEMKIIQKELIPIQHLKPLSVNLEELYHLRYLRFRYGNMSIENYEQMQKKEKDLEAIIIELERTEDKVWLIYFTPSDLANSIDSYFNVLKFERIWLPAEVKGKAIDFMKEVKNFNETSEQQINQAKEKLMELKETEGQKLFHYIQQLKVLEKVNEIKKYMAHDEKGSFYFVGWIPMEKVKTIVPALKQENLEFVIKSHDEVASIPPTHLKNHKLVKPFETIVNMYGIPNYTEMDPTTLVAITAFFMFGFMFGDIGQGAVILFIGLLLSKAKKALGPVLTAGGISAILFGFAYGSVFGKEGIIKGILPSPMSNINTMLIAGIASGAILILIAMIVNIRNGLKNGDKERIFFDKNGLAGLLFYTTILVVVIGFLQQGKLIISLGMLLILLGLPLILIIGKEKLGNILNHRKENKKTSIVEKIFEIIEMLLSMASNTISFVRLAAFAINHVGLCMAVYILAEMVGGAGSLVVAVIGNVIVIVLEGLIVAIQVLRLEYYELFSRFYTGNGREYKPMD
jgi:V/A-type H+-transporting ATPase subunit I